ncbi:TetR/AcrR family transcriptional regulator [Nocardia noduli]|uniref:TetR/AcrR family transcriptional regulator n=1 Tax=Nocardia noduli TaxID=2815722 RepID=UPI001C21C115|nr:TetR/AcrR family transcriptional regulator [Nocardia noduli]
MSSDNTFPTPPWWRTNPARPTREPLAREPLSRQRIIDAAMTIVDTEGLDALSMRRLGDELGTTASALYAHVADKDNLIELMFDHVLSEVPIPEVDPDDWQKPLEQYCRDALRVMLNHRDLARVTLGRAPFGPNGLPAMENLLALTRAGGLPDRVAAYAVDLLGSYIGATAIICDKYRQPEAGDDEPDRQDLSSQMRGYLEQLPPERFPILVALAHPLTDADGDARFELGLDIILRGLASYAEATAPRSDRR